jgi:hypothetical protein
MPISLAAILPIIFFLRLRLHFHYLPPRLMPLIDSRLLIFAMPPLMPLPHCLIIAFD